MLQLQTPYGAPSSHQAPQAPDWRWGQRTNEKRMKLGSQSAPDRANILDRKNRMKHVKAIADLLPREQSSKVSVRYRAPTLCRYRAMITCTLPSAADDRQYQDPSGTSRTNTKLYMPPARAVFDFLLRSERSILCVDRLPRPVSFLLQAPQSLHLLSSSQASLKRTIGMTSHQDRAGVPLRIPDLS